MVAAYYGHDWSEEQLASTVVQGKFGITAPSITGLARRLGYYAEVVSATLLGLRALIEHGAPPIVCLRTTGVADMPSDRHHAVVVTRIAPELVTVNDPATGEPHVLRVTDFLRAWAATENTTVICLPGREER
jgi:ABC-type bacteriocin/lantibiotic exporter with double-glycine peptidase domain